MKTNTHRNIGAAVLVAVQLAGATPVSAAVPGLERVSAQSGINSNSPKSAIARCPGDKRVIGTGGFIVGGTGQVVIDDVTPNAPLTNVTVTGFEDDDGTANTWAVVAIAVCANPLPGLELFSETRQSNSNFQTLAAVSCPSGKRLVGVGGDITGGLGQVTMKYIAPSTSSTDDRVRILAFEDQDLTAANWSLRALAICANLLPGLEQVRAVSGPQNSTSPKSATVSCPSGKRVLSAGGRLSGDTRGEVILDDLNARETSVEVTAYEDQDGTPAIWDVTAIAICANP